MTFSVATSSSEDYVEPAAVVRAMACAVERVRRMAVNVFNGDAALFADARRQTPK
jgi:hypothetical protein